MCQKLKQTIDLMLFKNLSLIQVLRLFHSKAQNNLNKMQMGLILLGLNIMQSRSLLISNNL